MVFETGIFGDFAIKTLILKAHQQTLEAFRLYPLFYGVILIPYMALFWYLGAMLEPVLKDPATPFLIRFFLPMTQVIFDLVLFVAFLLALQNLERGLQTFKQFLSKNLEPLASEGLKAGAFTIIGTLLFVLPGIVLHLLFTFFPFVVVFDKTYADGNRSALKRSVQLVKAHFFTVLAFALLDLTIPLLLIAGPKLLGADSQIYQFFAYSFLFYFSGFSVMFFYGLYKSYEEKLCRSENDPANS